MTLVLSPSLTIEKPANYTLGYIDLKLNLGILGNLYGDKKWRKSLADKSLGLHLKLSKDGRRALLNKAAVIDGLKADSFLKGFNFEVLGAEVMQVTVQAKDDVLIDVASEAQDFLEAELKKRCANSASDLIPSKKKPSVPAGKTFTIRPIGDDISSRMSVWVDIHGDGLAEASKPIWFKVSCQQEVLVTRDKIKFGEKIVSSMVDTALIDTASMRGSALTDPNQIIDTIALANFKAGQVVKKNMVKTAPAVSFGEVVKVRSMVGAIAIETEAESLDEGEVGEKISLKSLSSEDAFWGQVIGKGYVAVKQEI